MKFEFLGNAGGIFTGSSGTKILCDPWIKDGVFEGSWFHYPPLKTNLLKLKKNIDAIYLSHIHPDHFDERYFDFSNKLPIIILDQWPNFLKKILINKGYKNLIEIKNNQTKKFKEFQLTMYKPFTKHVYEESIIGNLVDSALVLKDKNNTVINFNDNNPDKKACEFLKKKFKNLDLAMLNYNAAGPYPSCFDNLNKKKKINEHKKILKRNFNHLCEIIPILKPKSVFPFAGSYIIGGKNYNKNEYLGTTTAENCAKYLRKNLNFKCKIFCLNENQIFDIQNPSNFNNYKKINIKKMKNYIKSLRKKKYTYENDALPNIQRIKIDIANASKMMSERLKKYNVKVQTNVYLELFKKKIQIVKGLDRNKKLICKLDLRLLRRILDKKAHWNNAEIGTHISFKRFPNKMEPDIHTSLSFFHL